MPDTHIPDHQQNEGVFSIFSGQQAMLFQTFFLSSIIGVIYYLVNFITQEIRKRLTCSISMESGDQVQRKVLKFLTENGYLKFSMSNMKVQLKPKERTWWWLASKNQNAKPEVEYLPGGGNHIFTYEGTKMWASQVEGPTLSTGYERKPTRTETLYITCYGQNTTPLKNLVQASIDYSEEKETEMMKIY